MVLVHVKVTADHIAIGQRTNNRYCPVALALEENGLVDVEVYTYGFRLASGVVCDLPTSAMHFISLFDYNFAVEPFEFSVSVPS